MYFKYIYENYLVLNFKHYSEVFKFFILLIVFHIISHRTVSEIILTLTGMN